jgi:LacI family transcriptional regulator
MASNNSLTLEEIAQVAGVSRSTVSRVINDNLHVSKDMRQRVQAVIRQLNYQPHQAARSLAGGRTCVLGLVFPATATRVFSDPFYPLLIQGITHACNQHNYALSLFLSHTKADEQKLYSRISRRGLLDGVVTQGGHGNDDFIANLIEGYIPFIALGRPFNLSHANYIDIDNEVGAQAAVIHLSQLGYRRIGTISGSLDTIPGHDRQAGYQKAMRLRGLEVDEELVVEGDFTEIGGYYAMQRLLLRKPEAVFVASDTMAMGALRAVREAGLSVPGDIALVGFDDLPQSAVTNPPLTTVRQPIHQVGIKLVETLLDIIEDKADTPRRIIFNTELVIRGSCGSRL